MIDCPVHVYNNASHPLVGEPVTLGVPFAKGVLPVSEDLALCDQRGQLLTVQTRPLTRWSDGSVKWLLCDFFADLPPRQESVFHLVVAEDRKKDESPLRAFPVKEGWQVDTGKARFVIDGKTLRPFLQVQTEEKALLSSPSQVLLHDAEGRCLEGKVEALRLKEQGPLRLSFSLNGWFCSDRRRLVRFEGRLQFYAGSARCLFEIRLHNPQAARHPGNLWDLGDPASVLFCKWSLRLPLPAEQKRNLRLRTEADGPCREMPTATGGRLLQDSSGGENWQSPVHRAADGRPSPSFRGWRLRCGDTHVSEGLRAQPLVCWDRVAVSVDHFWQRFPKGIAWDGEGLEMELLPEISTGLHELQGGEQVTERIRFDFCSPEPAASWGETLTSVRCAPQVYRRAGITVDDLSAVGDSRYRNLLAVALDQSQGFYTKREQIDEYGWRHFGELYADHEAAFHKEERLFVSHYNNQYDPLASFYRQFFAGGDHRWGDLARDLAAHVADIDINHTDADREEYCHGLFWHTDHYLDAGLSTHRMASREHLTQKNPAFCGGGPAAEHCYTSGLKLHHLHSGDPRCRELVLQLADWCWRSLHGPQTVGAALLRSVKSLSRWRRDKGSAPIWPRYPFTRGTGNGLNAALDALELSGDRRWLQRAAKLVRGTVHPHDRPGERNLLDAEACWSYTVFLAALGRFLVVKVERDEPDDDYAYGRESLLTYARWMTDYEYPYLEKPEILEFPNETWAGQDLRKSVVFYHAAGHAQGGERERFLERSRFFLDAGLDHLANSATRHYTRPLALVLQNGWAAEALVEGAPIWLAAEGAPAGSGTPCLTVVEVMRRSFADLVSVLGQTGPRREWRWLRARLGKG